ncbi:hypothetical protein SEMRO_2348_G324300.1 [Seminavis robusta]|uniref:Uncharacterized protein n=1 Tax=Seminavis robusta TaxID=568900 RepID=A0A9N8HX37_9STRA|nr:hypothetical protein SEMRO_2348_G324300.1 [Seminavis robusta]|eukprot:Sro2348_g324300.1 n/a (326) ;mRNA; f:4799-6007
MKNKIFAAPKGIAYRHVSNIGSTKTIEQRRTVTDLYLDDWSNNRGEKAAADHLRKEYCIYPRWNWNYACSGEVGVYPTNCPNESFNRHGIKSVAADCSKNASLAAFLVHTAPRLLQEDAHTRADPCTIEIPRSASIFAIATSGFLREKIDVVSLGRDAYGNPSSWLVNVGYKIGIPIDDRRIRLVLAAMEGNKIPFEDVRRKHKMDLSPDQVADMMSGLGNSSKRRCLSKMIDSFDSYLASLNNAQLSRVARYLGLFRSDNKERDPMKGLTTQCILDNLLSFYDNPAGHRAMLLGSRKQDSPFVVVKALAGKVKDASMPEKENNK